MEKLLESIGKILKAIVSSEFFWLIVGALAAYSLAVIATDDAGIDAEITIPIPIFQDPKIGALHLFLISVALLLIKVVAWLAQQKELIKALKEILQKIFTERTFWLIVVALAIFATVDAVPATRTLTGGILSEPKVFVLVAVALILAGIVLWIVRKIIARTFL